MCEKEELLTELRVWQNTLLLVGDCTEKKLLIEELGKEIDSLLLELVRDKLDGYRFQKSISG